MYFHVEYSLTLVNSEADTGWEGQCGRRSHLRHRNMEIQKKMGIEKDLSIFYRQIKRQTEKNKDESSIGAV